MSIPEMPRLKAAAGATAVQRLIAFAAVVLLVGTVLFWPEISSRTAGAFAQSQDNNYQPFQCDSGGAPGSQAHRMSLQLYGGTGNKPGSSAYPCISGVKWKLTAGDVSNNNIANTVSCFLCSAWQAYPNSTIGLISGAYSEGSPNITLPANGTLTGLTHVGFKGLLFCTGANAPAFNIANWSCNQPASGIKLYADSSTTAGGVTPGNNYVLNVSPSGPITIGGSNVLTDIWGDGSSVIRVPTPSLPLSGTGCSAAGGTDVNWGCRISLSAFSGTIANWFAQGNSFPITGVDINFYYMISHADGNIDPYTTAPPGNSVLMPNTRLLVNDGS